MFILHTNKSLRKPAIQSAMSLLPMLKRRRRDAVDMRDSQAKIEAKVLIDFYEKEKTKECSIIHISKQFRKPLIYQALWAHIKQSNDNAFLMYGIDFRGEQINLMKLEGIDNKAYKNKLGTHVFTEIHIMRSTAKSIAAEIGVLFTSNVNANLLNSHFYVNVSEISCFKEKKTMSYWELRRIQGELKLLVGAFDVFEELGGIGNWLKISDMLLYVNDTFSRFRITISETTLSATTTHNSSVDNVQEIPRQIKKEPELL